MGGGLGSKLLVEKVFGSYSDFFSFPGVPLSLLTGVIGSVSRKGALAS